MWHCIYLNVKNPLIIFYHTLVKVKYASCNHCDISNWIICTLCVLDVERRKNAFCLLLRRNKKVKSKLGDLQANENEVLGWEKENGVSFCDLCATMMLSCKAVILWAKRDDLRNIRSLMHFCCCLWPQKSLVTQQQPATQDLWETVSDALHCCKK